MPREWNAAGLRKLETLKQALAGLPEAGPATLAWDLPGIGGAHVQLSKPGDPAGREVEAAVYRADESFPETFQLAMHRGRFFSKEYFQTDTVDAVVLNEKAVLALGLQTGAGERVRIGNSDLRVIGVIEDFHSSALWEPIKPAVFVFLHGSILYRYLAVRITSPDVVGAMTAIREAWRTTYPDTPFEYQFIDKMIDAAYGDAVRGLRLARAAAGFALFLACLGLFALAAFATERRTREIGIRKVLGASAANIALMLSAEFTRLVLLAAAFAAAAAYFYLSNWLADFAYRIRLGPGPFVLAALAALLLTWLIAGYQAVQAALTNPVDCLRDE